MSKKIIFTLNGDEFESIKNGGTGCNGCVFNGDKSRAVRGTACVLCSYGDSGIQFKRKSSNPDGVVVGTINMSSKGGDDEWDAKYEIFERHYPLIKWAVVAGLLCLVWLVSL